MKETENSKIQKAIEGLEIELTYPSSQAKRVEAKKNCEPHGYFKEAASNSKYNISFNADNSNISSED